MSLKGRVAIVTGASGGIGSACARRLARDGAAVVVHYHAREAAAEALAAEIRAEGGAALPLQADLSDPAAPAALVAAATEAFGRLDLLVNNAAVAEVAALEAIDAGHVQRHFAANVGAVLFASQAAARAFGEAGGAIVNVSSINASQPPPGGAVYSATKAAVEAITKSLAIELGPRGIRVNAVAPGATDTGMLRSVLPPGMAQQIREKTPLGNRLGTPDDIAAVVAFLAGPDAAWITGQVINASGGLQI